MLNSNLHLIVLAYSLGVYLQASLYQLAFATPRRGTRRRSFFHRCLPLARSVLKGLLVARRATHKQNEDFVLFASKIDSLCLPLRRSVLKLFTSAVAVYHSPGHEDGLRSEGDEEGHRTEGHE